jgi:hypothetical protein
VGVAVDAAARRVYDVSFPPRLAGGGGSSFGAMHILDARTGHILQTLAFRNLASLALDAQTQHVLIADGSGLKIVNGANGQVVRTVALPAPPEALAVDARHARVIAVTPASFVPVQDRWAWVPGWLRRQLPFLPPPTRAFHTVEGNVRVLALPRA